jgi:mRNA interferase ChpB
MGSGTKTQGAVLVNMTKSLDLQARNAKKIESVPDEIVMDAMYRLEAILDR